MYEKNKNWVNQTYIGDYLGISAKAVGLLFEQHGLKVDNKPTEKAFKEKYVEAYSFKKKQILQLLVINGIFIKLKNY